MKSYYVYIVTNKTKTVLYTGVTNDLHRRIVQHYLSRGKPKTFAGKYRCYRLIYFEEFHSIDQAIAAEKKIKSKRRSWKENLITEFNPKWTSFNERFFDVWPPDEALAKFY